MTNKWLASRVHLVDFCEEENSIWIINLWMNLWMKSDLYNESVYLVHKTCINELSQLNPLLCRQQATPLNFILIHIVHYINKLTHGSTFNVKEYHRLSQLGGSQDAAKYSSSVICIKPYCCVNEPSGRCNTAHTGPHTVRYFHLLKLDLPRAWSNTIVKYPALFWAAVTLLYHPEQTEPRTEAVLFNLPWEQRGNILSRSASFYQNPLGFPQGNKLHLLIWHWQLSMCSNNVVSYYTLNCVTS